ncbi:MAG: ABC transporter ATP-binding protein [Lachnospiraceae bacterium]|nr:ABC transporter ATP-binding protein [Lachnospiraceae bacterium]
MIELKNVKKVYSTKEVETVALQNISVMINEGEFVMLLGRSGCGKTTLLNILGGIDTMSEGSYLFEGTEMSRMKGKQLAEFRNTKIGYVFQAYYLIDELDALHNVEVPLGYAGIRKSKRRERARKALAKVGLEDRLKHYPSQLSGGQQQRVAIARAIVNNPRVLLADEPTGNLDEVNCHSIMQLLEELHKQGTTIIMVTHDVSLTKYATRVINL